VFRFITKVLTSEAMAVGLVKSMIGIAEATIDFGRVEKELKTAKIEQKRHEAVEALMANLAKNT
jgi:hypothetical protein